MRILELIKKWTLIVVHSERGGGGGGGDSEPPPAVTPQQTAGNVLAAQQATNPQAAALEFGIQQQYMPQLAQLGAQSREIAQPGGQALGQNLMDVTLQQLLSPTGITGEQQMAQDATRTRAVEGAQEAQRTRANLGGGLYGGRAQAAEQGDINNLMQQFSTEDIQLQQQQRQFSQQMALQQMAQYLGVPVQTLNFQSPAASGNVALGADVQQRQQNIDYQAQQDAARSAMWKSVQNMIAPGINLLGGAGGGGSMDMGGGGYSQYGNLYGGNTPSGVTDTGTYSSLAK